MEDARDEILPRARLAEQEHGRVVTRGESLDAGDPLDEVVHGMHRRAPAYEREAIGAAHLATLEELEALTRSHLAERTGDDELELLEVHGLLNVVERARLHGAHRGLDRSEARHHDDR